MSANLQTALAGLTQAAEGLAKGLAALQKELAPQQPAAPTFSAEEKTQIKTLMGLAGLSQTQAESKILANRAKGSAKPAAQAPKTPTPAAGDDDKNIPGVFVGGKGRPSARIMAKEKQICVKGFTLGLNAKGRWAAKALVDQMTAENMSLLSDAVVTKLLDTTATCGFGEPIPPAGRAQVLQMVAARREEINAEIAEMAAVAENPATGLDDDEGGVIDMGLDDDELLANEFGTFGNGLE